MRFLSNTYLNATDNAQERDPSPADQPWKPLTDNDDDGGDQTTEVEPDL